MLCRNRAFDCGNDSFDVRKRGVFVDRIVTDHDVGFADENRRADHLAPKIGPRGDVRDDHLTDAAIFSVFLHHHQPPGFVDRPCDRIFVPGNDRPQIEKLDAHFSVDLSERFERFLNGVAPRHQCHIRSFVEFARLT